jgi:hypothetical protein
MEIVKHDPSYGGVLDLPRFSEKEQDELLELVVIEDVWGIFTPELIRAVCVEADLPEWIQLL